MGWLETEWLEGERREAGRSARAVRRKPPSRSQSPHSSDEGGESHWSKGGQEGETEKKRIEGI